ncbi:hypothetical protein [Halomonas sp. YLGW01]|uniref:hypothetical protein n=1 Tax=Halomonas sp. YLGW01 TaxID=2773308 RepID=UPI0017821D3B|nr:hypothetical protein [Halomonas sp. YLGW01]
MRSLVSAFPTADLALAGEDLCVGETRGLDGVETGGWPRFWSYWFSAGVPVARSH